MRACRPYVVSGNLHRQEERCEALVRAMGQKTPPIGFQGEEDGSQGLRCL